MRSEEEAAGADLRWRKLEVRTRTYRIKYINKKPFIIFFVEYFLSVCWRHPFNDMIFWFFLFFALHFIIDTPHNKIEKYKIYRQ